jgi:undecaprenyl-diphosphatase
MERVGNTDRLPLSIPASQRRILAWLMSLALATMSIYTFAELAGDVRTGEGFAFDQAVMEAMHGLASPWLTVAMRLITASASGLVAAGLAMGLGIPRWRRVERRAEAIILAVTLSGSAALGQGLKFLFTRPRPQAFPWLTTAGGWSFPSGHTLTAVVLGSLLAWLIGQQLSGWQRVALWTVAGLWVGLVGVSRIYLGVHYPSDVLASLAVGGLCLPVALYIYRVTIPQPAA